MLTVIGFGSKMRVINFIAPKDIQGGHVNSAAEICIDRDRHHETKSKIKADSFHNEFGRMLTFLYRLIRLESSKGK